MGQNPPASAEGAGSVPGSGRAPGAVNATCASTLAWEIPWTEEASGLSVHGVAKELDMTEQLQQFSVLMVFMSKQS